MKKVVILLLVFLGSPILLADFKTQLSYQDLLTVILSESKNIKIRNIETERNFVRSSSFKWSLSPSINLRLSRLLISSGDRVATGSISANLNLFNSFKDKLKYSLLKLESKSAETGLNLEKLNIERDLLSQYMDWQKAYKRKKYLNDSEEIRKKAYASIKSLVERGERQKSELLLFEIEYTNTIDRLEQADLDLLDVKSKIGLNLENPNYLYKKFPKLKFLLTESNCKLPLKKTYFSNHISIKGKKIDLKKDFLEKERLDWDYGPTVDLSYSKFFYVDDLTKKGIATNSDTLSLVASMPIWNGLKSYYEKKDKLFDIRKKEIEVTKSSDELAIRHSSNCRKISLMERKKTLTVKVIKNYSEILRLSKLKYQMGEISGMDYIDQQLRAFNTRLNLISIDFEIQKLLLSQWWLHKGVSQ